MDQVVKQIMEDRQKVLDDFCKVYIATEIKDFESFKAGQLELVQEIEGTKTIYRFQFRDPEADTLVSTTYKRAMTDCANFILGIVRAFRANHVDLHPNRNKVDRDMVVAELEKIEEFFNKQLS